MSESIEIVSEISGSDIICGRKGVALKHPGNLAYRKVVGLNKELYATCLKNEKLSISKSIVAAMREVGGRFLERVDGKTSASLDEKDKSGNLVAWKDIGDKRAIEKTSQALREGQPKLLKKLALQHVICLPHSQVIPYRSGSSYPSGSLSPTQLNWPASGSSYASGSLSPSQLNRYTSGPSYHPDPMPLSQRERLNPSDALTINPTLASLSRESAAVAPRPNYPQLNPYARPVRQAVTPPPRPSLLPPHILSQIKTEDLYLMALMLAANER